MSPKEAFHLALAEAMSEVSYVQKDGTNSFHKYKYASAEAVLKKVNAALSKRGIAVSSCVTPHRVEPGHAIVHVRLTLCHGDFTHTIEGLGEGSDKGDKATMKALTAGIKYALSTGFLISWGDDPEADNSTDKAADVFDSLMSRLKSAHSPDSLNDVVKLVTEAIERGDVNKRQQAKLRAQYEESAARFR